MPLLRNVTIATAAALSILATPAVAINIQPAVVGASHAPVVQAQFLGKGNTPEQEVRRIFSRHFYQGSFIGTSVRKAAGANAVLRDERVIGQFGQCSYVSYRGGKAIVCNRV
ncbi:MAG: hypothetical protein AAFO70_04035 [Pseudomonadota bacterium]